MMASCPACLGKLYAAKALQSERLICINCRSEIIPARRSYIYDESYSVDRGHHAAEVHACKEKSYHSHLRSVGMSSLKNKNILEFGYGGGAFLKLAADQGANVFGVEVHSGLLQQAAALGIPAKNLSLDLETFIENKSKIDFVFYFDSFEHILDPETHLKKLNRIAEPGTKAVVIMPRVDSLSRSLLKSAWPHDVPEHWMLYSKAGLVQMWQSEGWRVERVFRPKKNISLEMILRHWHIRPSGFLLKALRTLPSFWFNLGEMGVVFEKNK